MRREHETGERHGLSKWNLKGNYEPHGQRAKEKSFQEQKQLEKKARQDHVARVQQRVESEIRVKQESDHE